MATLTDAAGESWTLDLRALDSDQVTAFRKAVGDTRRGPPDWRSLVHKLVTSPDKLGRGLWVLCRPEARQRNLDEAAFAARICTRDVLSRLPDVFIAACREPRTRPAHKL